VRPLSRSCTFRLHHVLLKTVKSIRWMFVRGQRHVSERWCSCLGSTSAEKRGDDTVLHGAGGEASSQGHGKNRPTRLFDDDAYCLIFSFCQWKTLNRRYVLSSSHQRLMPRGSNEHNRVLTMLLKGLRLRVFQKVEKHDGHWGKRTGQ